MTEPHHERNRRSWNAATRAHQSHKADQGSFFRDGGCTLFPEELALLGDVRGARTAHLLCNCGQDSLSLAARGADVVGVDISDRAIEEARRLSTASGIEATFELAEASAWLEVAAGAGRRFDLVFLSYGALPWIEDLPRFTRRIAAVLSPGGRLAVMEFHPLAWSVDADGALLDDYFVTDPIVIPGGVSDYVARSDRGLAPMGYQPGIEDFSNPEPAVVFQWTVAGLVQAVVDAGLGIVSLREYPWANGCRLHDGMREVAERRFVRAEGVIGLPLMLGLSAAART